MIKEKNIFFACAALLFSLLLSSCVREKTQPLIGVAWRSNQNAETFVATCKAIEAAGGKPVLLQQILSADLAYNANMLTDAKNADGSLSYAAAKLVKCNTFQNGNVGSMLNDVTAVVFPGGEDISPSLYYDAPPVEAAEGFSAERDVSDYLLMSYCLVNDIPMLCICRGMQFLSVISGAKMIQDIPYYMAQKGVDYRYDHRDKVQESFVFHNVTVTSADSLLRSIVGSSVIENAPSWHHQAVDSVDGTRLVVTAVTNTSGIDIIEAVERPDKSFVLGLQFHPEIAVVRELDYTSITYFRAIVNAARHTMKEKS